MINGMSIQANMCQILGEDSQNSLHWKKHLQKDVCGPERDWQRSKQQPDQIMYARSFDENW